MSSRGDDHFPGIRAEHREAFGRAHLALVRLWDKAKEHPDYVKAEWRELDNAFDAFALDTAGAHRTRPQEALGGFSAAAFNAALAIRRVHDLRPALWKQELDAWCFDAIGKLLAIAEQARGQ
jgi:hypothetical protein